MSWQPHDEYVSMEVEDWNGFKLATCEEAGVEVVGIADRAAAASWFTDEALRHGVHEKKFGLMMHLRRELECRGCLLTSSMEWLADEYAPELEEAVRDSGVPVEEPFDEYPED